MLTKVLWSVEGHKSAGSQEKAIYEGVLISGWYHALLNIIKVEIHLKLNQHAAHFSGPPFTCPLCNICNFKEQN